MRDFRLPRSSVASVKGHLAGKWSLAYGWRRRTKRSYCNIIWKKKNSTDGFRLWTIDKISWEIKQKRYSKQKCAFVAFEHWFYFFFSRNEHTKMKIGAVFSSSFFSVFFFNIFRLTIFEKEIINDISTDFGFLFACTIKQNSVSQDF